MPKYKEQIKEFDKKLRQMLSDALYECLSNKHPVTGKQMTIAEGKRYFTKRVNDVLQDFSKALDKTQRGTIERIEKKLIIWIAEYVYYKVNPKSKMDVPSIVYEQVEKDFGKFLDKLKKG